MTVILKTTPDLIQFCNDIITKAEPYITVDTEFMRESTYYSQLCLIQVATKDRAVAIDPLAPDMDLKPFFEILQNESILKVFHAARQDIEIFYQLSGAVPSPLFDSQVAAMVCGYGDSVSYEALVNSLAKAQLDKGSRFTDWSRRPLSDKQLAYALDDVIHLRVVFEKLKAKLISTGRGEWLNDEMEILLNPNTYEINPYDVWKRIKYRSAKPKMLAVLRELTAVREAFAIKSNVPRARMLKDESLLEIAATCPKTTEELAQTRGVHDGQAKSPFGQELLAAVQKALALPKEDYPQDAFQKHTSPSGQGAVVDMLRLLLKIKCEQEGVAQKLVANSADLEELARSDAPQTPVLKGWRYDLFGKHAMDLKEGRLAFTLKDRKIQLVEVK